MTESRRAIRHDGRHDAITDDALIGTISVGDHFGELRARDWGRGYGYAHLATVRCAEASRLLELTTEDFQSLVDIEPTVKPRLAETVAERLEQG